MIGYTMMSDEEWGINIYIKEDKAGRYIILKGEDETKEEKLYLQDKPIAFQRAMVCRGTACYRAKRQNSKRWEFVVKFSWRPDKARAEGHLLKLAKQRKVWGVPQLFDYQDLESIAEMRAGMQFGKPQQLPLSTRNSLSESQSGSSAFSKNPLSSLSLRQSDKASTGQAKRSRSSVSHRQTSPGTSEEDDGSFDNRIFSCLVISPPGRPINEFKSVREFLEGCRDSIKAHRSLYNEGKILHRDISVNNFIITDAEGEGDPRGMLIDLDAATELDSGSSGGHNNGTLEFMAIEVLEGGADTYRHDLESFFYVFLWVIICHSRKVERYYFLPKSSRLKRWYEGSFDDLAENKVVHMAIDTRFTGLRNEFAPRFNGLKELAEKLRGILFLSGNRGGFFTGTYDDPDQLYKPMIDAFDTAIRKHINGESWSEMEQSE
jgi:hypothetical protein